MSIKQFSAASWEEALRQVKQEFGDAAVILHSKTYKDGGVLGVGQRTVVEITATDDEALAAQGAREVAQARQGVGIEAARLDEATRHNYARILEKAYAVAATRAGGEVPPKPPTPAATSTQPATLPRPTTATPGASGLFQNSKLAAAKPGEDARIQSLMHDISELKALVANLVDESSTSNALAGISAPLKDIHQRLLENDVSENVARDICLAINRKLAGADLDDERKIQAATLEVVASMVPLAGPMRLSANKTNVIALIGPTGVGKTTTLSKLAANLMIKEGSRRVGFITIDAYRLGATVQLKTLANILDVPVRVVMNPNEIKTTIRELGKLDVVFIDTAGRSQHDRMKMNELKSFLDAATPDETHLCISATTHPVHLLSVLDHFGSLHVDSVILTKLDEAASFGPVLDVAMRSGKALSYLTVGQDIPDDIEVATGERLARLLLGLDAIAG